MIPYLSSVWMFRQKKNPALCSAGFLIGSSTWARTRDLRINSPALYRLSYRGIIGMVLLY